MVFHEDTLTTGLNNQFLSTGLTIYPIPATHIVNVQSNELVSAYQIFDVSGKIITKKSEFIPKKEFSISVNNIISGVYFLRIRTSKGVESKKLIIN